MTATLSTAIQTIPAPRSAAIGDVDSLPQNNAATVALIRRYQAGDQGARDTVWEAYRPWIRRLAEHRCANLPSSVDVKDLESVGNIAFGKAIEDYDPDRETAFKTFVTPRVNGAMLDELRNLERGARPAREQQKMLERAATRVATELGVYHPNDAFVAVQVARELALSRAKATKDRNDRAAAVEAAEAEAKKPVTLADLEPSALLELREARSGAVIGSVVPLILTCRENDHDDGAAAEHGNAPSDPKSPTPDEAAAQREYMDLLEAILGPDDLRLLWLQFAEGLTQQEVGTRLGMSGSNVCRRTGLIRERLVRMPLFQNLIASLAA